jgi:uncharacterized phiE125 gp8 family phage protein
MALVLKTAPLIEPLDLDATKLHCRIDSDTEDTLITAYIKAAREYCEGFQNKSYINRTYELWLDEFPNDDEIELPMGPLVSVSGIDVYDTANSKTADTTLTNYFIDTKSNPGRLCLAYGKTWPTTTLRESNSICITFIAGYGSTASSVPESVKQAMLLLISGWYENRESITDKPKSTIPFAVESLLWMDRVF